MLRNNLLFFEKLDWELYKTLCDRPDYWSRWMLEQTAFAVAPLLDEMLEAVTCGVSLEKPEDHIGGPEVDMFQLDISETFCLSITKAIELAYRQGRTTTGSINRDLSGFTEAWNEYLVWLKNKAEK
jgi:hypothetical protein